MFCPLSVSDASKRSSPSSLGKVFHCEIKVILKKEKKGKDEKNPLQLISGFLNFFHFFPVNFFIIPVYRLFLTGFFLASAQLNCEASTQDRVNPLAFWFLFLCDAF